MHGTRFINGKILITGGSSGLGLELVKLYLKKGCFVVATGRKTTVMPGYEEHYEFHNFDLADLSQTARAVKRIRKDHNFSIIINNAGVFGPPDHSVTVDGFEYTFQVNFLSHLLLNDIIFRDTRHTEPVKFAAVISPVYTLADAGNLLSRFEKENYRPFRAYSASKLCLALMCGFLPERYPAANLRCLAYSPGVFSSGIFRLQTPSLKKMYLIAAPLMKSPQKAAQRLTEILESEDFPGGSVYAPAGKAAKELKIEKPERDRLMKDCYERLKTFIG